MAKSSKIIHQPYGQSTTCMVFIRQHQEPIKNRFNYSSNPPNRPGTQLPAERSLANQFHVSLMTLRKAINQLQQEGILERRSNQGIFVRPAMLARPVASPIGYGMS